MKSVELNEKSSAKRIKRSFPRHEVYHRWIHSNDYCYTNKGSRYNVSGFLDWLIIGDFGKTYTDSTTKEEIIDTWSGWRKTCCVAAINREKKQILVSLKYPKQSKELLDSIPDDYEVFKTEEEIPRADILSTGGLSDVLHLHSEYLIQKFIERDCSPFYMLLTGQSKTCNTNYDEVFNYSDNEHSHNDYTDIINFVKKYKVKKYDWYKEASSKKVAITVYKGWNKEWINVYLPSLKQVVIKRIFKSNEIDLINKKVFYTKYCYGNGISYKTVEKKWNSPITKEEFEKLSSSINHPMLWDDLNIKPNTWNDSVSIIHESIIGHIDIINKENEEISKQNYQKALLEAKKINEDAESLDIWRKGKTRENNRIEFKRWVRSLKKGVVGHWVVDCISTKVVPFSNTQLRLTGVNNQTVNTSRFANVSLDDAIKMWRLYKILTKGRVGIEGQPIMIRLEDRHYNVGVYNLRAIQYTQKKTDDGELLDKWEWCVVIGCHYLWIDDFMDFIKYYNLYALFDIEAPEEISKDNKETKEVNKNFKIKIKK